MVHEYGFINRRLTCVAIALLMVFGGSSLALAEKAPLDEVGDTAVEEPPDDLSAPDCFYTWSSPPRILVHMDGFLEAGGTASERTKVLAAISDVVDEFNKVGATSALVTKVELSPEPIAYPIDDQTFKERPEIPTIHVGFTNHFLRDTNAIGGGVALRDYDSKKPRVCPAPIEKVYLVFPGPNDFNEDIRITWNYDTPGDAFYEAGLADSEGRTWFRPVFLHELLHAFGFDHRDAEANYSFMNSRRPGGFPWANRPAKESIRPLPFEVGELRKRYPGSGTRHDIAVLNTWYRPPGKNAERKDKDPYLAKQKRLCNPSTGIGWSDVTSDGPCGIVLAPDSTPDEQLEQVVQDSYKICAGDKLRTSFTIANYSTAKMKVTATLWLSEDTVLNTLPEWQGQWKDRASETRHEITLEAAESELQSVIWTVPTLDLKRYYSIVRVEARPVNDPNIVVSDWIPLRLEVLGKSCDAK